MFFDDWAGTVRLVTEDEILRATGPADNARRHAMTAVVLQTDGSSSILTEVRAMLDNADFGDLGGPGA